MIFLLGIGRQVKKQSVTEDGGQKTEDRGQMFRGRRTEDRRQRTDDRRMIMSYDKIVKSTNTCHSGGACAGIDPV